MYLPSFVIPVLAAEPCNAEAVLANLFASLALACAVFLGVLVLRDRRPVPVPPALLAFRWRRLFSDSRRAAPSRRSLPMLARRW